VQNKPITAFVKRMAQLYRTLMHSGKSTCKTNKKKELAHDRHSQSGVVIFRKI